MLNKKDLYSRIVHDNPNSETGIIIKEYSDCNYFELCQSFLDIALNAQKFKNKAGGLSGCFQYKDINIAKQKAVDFLCTYHIKNVEAFFALLKKYYTLTASSDDKRQKYAYCMAENLHFPGYAGMFYDFTHISNDVFKKIVSEIKESFSQVLL